MHRKLPLFLSIVALAIVGLPVAGIGTAIASASPVGSWTAYVTNSGSNTVTPINTATNTAGTPIPVGDSPSAIAITPDGATAYVVNEGSSSLVAGSVTPINLATNTPLPAIPVGNDPTAVAITPDGSKAYIANEHDGTVTPIDTVTNTAGSPIICSCSPRTIVISPDGATAYVYGDTSQSVVPIDTATLTVRPAISTFNTTSATISPDGSTLYGTAFNSGSISRIDTATFSSLTPLQGFGAGFTLPFSIAASPDGAHVYWTDSNTFATMDTANPLTPPVTTPLVASGQIHGLALTPDGATAYVSNATAGTVTPINTATNTLGAPITVGSNPWAIAITPDQAPVARLQVARAPIGSPTVFDASASTVKYGSIASYAWDFGDGTTDMTNTPTTAHTYTGGSYTASVTETSSGGTSTTSVFTGQTASSNGGLRARATALGSLGDVGTPVVQQITPATGGTAGGTSVSIIGSGFTGATAVYFGSTPAAAVTVNGDNSITTTAPAAASASTVDVRVVRSPDASATNPADLFRYLGTAPATTTSCVNYCAVQYGTVDMSNTTTSTCNVCNVVGGVELLNVPFQCPGGGSPSQVPAGWVQITSHNGPLSFIAQAVTYQETIGSFVENNDSAALQLVNVCYQDGIPVQIPGSARAASAKASATAPKPHVLKACSATKPAPPCVSSKSITGNGVVHITMLLPETGSTFQIVSNPVQITKLTPAYGLTNASIKVTGKNMAAVTGAVIGGVQAPITSRTSKDVTITIPDGAQPGPVTLLTPNGPVLSPKPLAIGPTITTITKTAKVGAKVTIKGYILGGATGVSFNGTPGTIVSVKDTVVVALVPAGATAGPITVTTPNGPATSPTAFTPKA